MDEIGDRLDTITGLRGFGFPPDHITPPAAIVSYPEGIVFDRTYRRGKDTLTLPVVVVVGKPNDRSTVTRLGAYCDGSGGSSIKAVLESGTYTSFDRVRVTDVDFDVYTIGGNDYMGALFMLDIGGDGA
jgi:hypothetical protein